MSKNAFPLLRMTKVRQLGLALLLWVRYVALDAIGHTF